MFTTNKHHYIPYDFKDSLARFVTHAHRALTNQLQSNFLSAGFEVTPGHFRVLTILRHKDGITQQELSELIPKEKTGTARLVSALEKRGLVIRMQEKSDGRRKLVFLTSKGREILEGLEKVVQQTSSEAFHRISEEDMKICRNVLKVIIINLKRNLPV
jgi:DNA-binding MarR family transcriptional regulator